MVILKVEVLGSKIQIRFTEGSREEIENGICERKNIAGRTVEERPAKAADIARLPAATDRFGIPAAGGNDDDTPDRGHGDAPGTPGGTPVAGGKDDGKPDQGEGDAPATTLVARAGPAAPSVPELPEINGTAAGDRIRGTSAAEEINGPGGNDQLRCGGGNDIVNGGAGNDEVKGDLGNDVLNGGTGSDTYDGGVGRDTFVFTADGGLDKIKDFQHGIDLIDISAFDVASIDVLLAGAKERGGDGYIDLGGGKVIKLDDLTQASLSSSDFII